MCMIGVLPMVLFSPVLGDWEFYLLLVLYLNKDFLNGQSPLKRLLDTQVQQETDTPANEWQCFLRNTTFITWPLEILAVAITGRRRLGDYVANTQVADVSKSTDSWRKELAAYRVTAYTFYTLIGTRLYSLLLYALFSWLGF
ncbi:RDD family protein [Hymenobacter psychrophilus]|uniref:RDD family protein n=1 Tax=Hymenobacter psychrophilus TaxID=651662 RepID=A0A1H3P7G4_9BACT|nr:RDD family protein [Hymenobacter psychrophilus]